MGCCLCRDKNSSSNQSAGNGDLSNCQITTGEESSCVRKEASDKRSLLEILETVKRSADSESMENGICSGEVIKDANTEIISNDRTLTRPYSQSKYTVQNLLLTFRVTLIQICCIRFYSLYFKLLYR